MKITIHRGTKEIGGSCVEVVTSNTRILFDFGMPLVDSEKKPFDSKVLKGKTIEDLKQSGILPNIQGLYRDEKRYVDAIFITHSHLDHYGFLQFIHPEIPIYASEGAIELIEITGKFTPSKINISNQFRRLKAWGKDTVGDITVSNYLVDHSAFDARAFLIDADGKRLFYTGDFRSHGRKGKLFEKMIDNPPKDIDCLLMEGSMLGREGQKYKDETAVEARITQILKEEHKISFLFVSSQNIDRIVSAYRSCIKAKALFVIDIYTAYILHKLKPISKGIIQYNSDNVRVYFIKNQVDTLVRLTGTELLYKFKTSRIKIPEINSTKSKILMVMRDNSFFPILTKHIDKLKGSQIIYSMWNGYLKPEHVEIWYHKGINLEQVHTSGHAIVEDLQRFAKAVNPKTLIPIHTFEPEKYKQLFKNVILLKDGEEYTIS
ncbi:MAG: MBL fold metallo-hydrolase [Elusimicrobia bacterium]|nr:MBL fold metallo-hydrolase [Candidatus Liberimonas magnetica]